jgi:hypothetical protein
MSRELSSQVDIVRRAQALAEKLTAEPETAVKRSAFLSLVADFQARPEAEPARLLDLLKELEKGSGGHLQRGKTYVAQISLAAQSLVTEIERGDLSAQELRSLFGWTARLLDVKHSGKQQHGKEPPTEKGRGPRKQNPRPGPEKKRPGGGLGTLGDQFRDVLARFKPPTDSEP